MAKVWQELASGPTFGIAQPFADRSVLIENRIERLMAITQTTIKIPYSRATSLKITAVSLVGLISVEVASTVVILALMGCGPIMTYLTRFAG